MKPKRKSRIETEGKIFEAALTIFSQDGFEASTLKKIAAKAGVNEALIIRYYKSKAELLKSIIVEYFQRQEQAWVGLSDCETLEAEIREFFLREIRSDFKNREFVRLTLARVCVDSDMRDDMASRWAAWSKEGEPELAKRLKRFQEKGNIAALVDLASLSYLLQMEALGLGLAISLRPDLDQALIEKQVTAFAAIIARGLEHA